MPRYGIGSKSDSGCARRKRKRKQEEFLERQKDNILKHFRLTQELNPTSANSVAAAKGTETSELSKENPTMIDFSDNIERNTGINSVMSDNELSPKHTIMANLSSKGDDGNPITINSTVENTNINSSETSELSKENPIMTNFSLNMKKITGINSIMSVNELSPKHTIVPNFCDKGDNSVFTHSVTTDIVGLNSSAHGELCKDHSIDITFSNTIDNLIVNNEKILHDIGLWPQYLNDQQRKFIVENGPVRTTLSKFPSNDQNRHFSENFYIRKMPNSEIIDRRWLVYSVSLDSVFCFCCKLFCISSTSHLYSTGCNDWKHMGEILSSHESSVKHIESFHKWLELENRLRCNNTIDRQSELLIDSEKRHWKSVLERLLSIIQFLGQRNLAFRGTEEKLGSPKNGNFLGLVELLSKYDSVLSEHLRRIKNEEIKDHYLGNRIQNEIINLIGNKILETICAQIKKSKYYSIILDCTSDVSHREQMSLVIRYITCEENKVCVSERFVCFLFVNDSTGQGLSDTLLTKLQELNIPLEDCRGQGYDNGANMRGQNKGVQSRILQKNPKALFVPCGCHSWNLIIGDMAKSSNEALTFFGIVQEIYILFSASSYRWDILKKHVKNLTVKGLSETRWECRVQSVKAIRFQIGDVYDAIVEVSETTKDPKTKAVALSLAKQMKSFKFLMTLCIWYDILVQFNFVSKIMQSVDMKLDTAMELISKTIEFLIEFKKSGFENAKVAAKDLANELEMNASDICFPPESSLRRKKVTKQFSYESNDDPILDPELNYRINFFNTLLDQAIMSTKERFKQIENLNLTFGFLFKIPSLKKEKDSDIMNYCKVFSNLLDDVNDLELYSEIKVLLNIVPNTVTSPMKVLNYLYENNLPSALPNLVIALRILLTVPVTIATAERSFSKLKLIKTYLRSTMTDCRLSALSLISLENDLSSTLNFSEIIEEFAAQKARKVAF